MHVTPVNIVSFNFTLWAGLAGMTQSALIVFQINTLKYSQPPKITKEQNFSKYESIQKNTYFPEINENIQKMKHCNMFMTIYLKLNRNYVFYCAHLYWFALKYKVFWGQKTLPLYQGFS